MLNSEEKRIMDGMDRIIEKKKGITGKRAIYGILVLAVLSLLLIAIFGNRGSKYNVDISMITIDKVVRDVFQDYITEQGTVQPIQTIFLDAIEGGRVEEILIEEGALVSKGDIILRLSNNNLLLEITNNEAQVVLAVNELRTARLLMDQQKLVNKQQIIDLSTTVKQQQRMFRKNKILVEQNHISSEDFERSREDYESSLAKLKLVKENYYNDSVYRAIQISSLESSVESMEKSMQIIRRRLENLNLKAPVDGELASLTPEIGQVINYGNRIGTINILDSYKIRADIDEHYIERIHTGLMADCDFAGNFYPAEITKVYPEVQNGRFGVDLVFTGDLPEQIRIGQTTRIRLQLGESRQGLLIPKGGFYNKTGGQWVFVVDPSGDFAVKRDISIGRQNPRYYEVLDGLEEGEKVITSGYQHFADHDKLVLKNNR